MTYSMAQCLKITEKVSLNIFATFTFGVDKSSWKMPKMVNFGDFWKPEACGQTVLSDRSPLIGQKLAKNAKIENSNATF